MTSLPFVAYADFLEFLLPAPDAALVDLDAEAGPVQHRHVTVVDTQRIGDHIFGKARAGHGQAPGQRRHDRGEMQGRRRGDAQLAGLAGDVQIHAEPVAQPACFEYRTHAAELDRFEAHAKRCLGRMMALNIVLRMNALVGADRHAARRGDARHAGEIVGVDRLLEETEARIGDRTHVADAFVGVKTLIGVGGNQAVLAEQAAKLLRARGVGLGRSDADLDLVDHIAGIAARLRLAQIGRGIVGADHREQWNAVAAFAAKQHVQRLPGSAADEIVQRDFDRRLGAAVAVHLRVHRRRRAGEIVGRTLEQAGRHMGHRRHHAGDGLAGHGRRRGRFAPADDAIVGFDAHKNVVGAGDGLARHLHRLLHRQADRDGLDDFDPHPVPRIANAARKRRPADSTGVRRMATSGGRALGDRQRCAGSSLRGDAIGGIGARIVVATPSPVAASANGFVAVQM